MTSYDKFMNECQDEIAAQGEDSELLQLSRKWMDRANSRKYSYHFQWLGRPIIQYPQDMIAMQELIWAVQPDLIIETGIAHGGSLIFYASMLELNAACGGPQDAEVLGVDIDIRAHNREAIESHPMYKRISMIQGSSIAPEVIEQVRVRASGNHQVMVCLDSNHTHSHVLEELNAYALLTSVGSYCVVFDTVIEDMPDATFPDRPWGTDNNPKTALRMYLKYRPEFEIDKYVQNKFLITVAPDGFLKRIR